MLLRRKPSPHFPPFATFARSHRELSKNRHVNFTYISVRFVKMRLNKLKLVLKRLFGPEFCQLCLPLPHTGDKKVTKYFEIPVKIIRFTEFCLRGKLHDPILGCYCTSSVNEFFKRTCDGRTWRRIVGLRETDKYKTMGKECLIEERDSPTKYIGLSYI